jgi:hypothetical protein
MKAFTFALGGVLILAAPLGGQQTQVLVENDQIKIEVTKYSEPCAVLSADKENSNPQDTNSSCTELAVINKSREPITAWAATTETDVPGARHNPSVISMRSSDCVLRDSVRRGYTDPQILPHGTHRVALSNPTRVVFRAAVFSDGSVLGDPEWVKRIVQDRRQIYQETAIALQKLRAAKEAGTTREELVREFRELERQEIKQEMQSRRHPAVLADLMLPRLDVYGDVAGNLERGQAQTYAGSLSDDIDNQESMLLDMGNQLLVSKPPISDHAVPLGEPLDSPPPPEGASKPGPSAGIR